MHYNISCCRTQGVARGFATWKIRHTKGETYECDREFERKRRTNVCNSADVEDLPHNSDRLGLGGLRSGGWAGGGWGWGELGNWEPPNSNPLT